MLSVALTPHFSLFSEKSHATLEEPMDFESIHQ
jgi:hypothetical protein